MADPTQLPNERTTVASMNADLVNKLNFWSEELRRRGLIVEGVVMYDAASEIMMLRAELGAKPGRPAARRGLVGDVFRPINPP